MAIPVEFKSGKVEIYRRVKGRFETQGVNAAVHFGWLPPPKQDNQGPGTANRVCFIPSDESGKDGKFVSLGEESGIGPGYRPFDAQGKTFSGFRAALAPSPQPVKAFSTRPLIGIESVMTVSVWAVHSTHPKDESYQYEAVWELHRLTIEALYKAGLKDVDFIDRTFNVKSDHQYGRELRFTINVKEVIYESASQVAFPTGKIEGLDEE